MRIGVLGSGNAGRALAAGFLACGHDVLLGTRNPDKMRDWLRATPRSSAGSFADAANFGEVLALAVRGSVAARALRLAGTPNLRGKPVIDATNPVADQAPQDGVLHFFTSLEDSLMERLQREFSIAHFVKAFNSVGHQMMARPKVQGGPPSMFICGAHEASKRTISGLVEEMGWEPIDVGGLAAARAIEPLAMLWSIPAIRDQQTDHAFKLLRQNAGQ